MFVSIIVQLNAYAFGEELCMRRRKFLRRNLQKKLVTVFVAQTAARPGCTASVRTCVLQRLGKVLFVVTIHLSHKLLWTGHPLVLQEIGLVLVFSN